MRTRKVKSTGRFGAGYGLRARKKLVNIESKQRKKQTCPFCKKNTVKRKSKAIWNCRRCGKTFALDTFYLENK